MFASIHPWTFGWDALVAIGTLALAFVTLLLGIAALRGNRTARQALGIAQAELQASMFPLIESVPLEHSPHREATPPELIDYRTLGGGGPVVWRFRDVVDVNGESGGVFFSVPIRNVGPGIARISGTEPRALSVPDRDWTVGVANRGLIPPGEYGRLLFRLYGLREEAFAEVFYSDTSGNQAARVRFYIKGERDPDSGHMDYFVKGTAMWLDGEPYFVVGDPRVAERQPTSDATS
jgi:hypothetical protein